MGVRIALAAAIVALAVAGCDGGDPSPTSVPTQGPPSASTEVTGPPPTATPTTPAASPTPTPPPLPAAARADTPTGAESFAGHYIQVLDYASHSGDVQQLDSLGDCGTCRAQSKGITDFFANGGKVQGGEIIVRTSKAVRFVTTAALVNVGYDQSAGTTTDSTGEVTKTQRLSNETFALTLSWASGRWSVQKFQVVE